VQNDSSYISLQDVLDDFGSSRNFTREDPVMAYLDRIKQLHDPAMPKVTLIEYSTKLQDAEAFIRLKVECLEEISTKMVPETVLENVGDLASP
jgi:transformation/transcription domain-associated protein